MTAAVLLIAWRRPYTTSQVLERIRTYAPSRFYVACDGPRVDHPGEEDKVLRTQDLIESQVDWPCSLSTLYSKVNLGCCLGPARAINWFFEHEEEGIILEDDCLPHPDFFLYCENLLSRYREDERVWCISGSNFQDGRVYGDGSYYFSRYPHIWGWATWRRCWQHFDASLARWPSLVETGLISSIFDHPLESYFWKSVWEKTFIDYPDITWWDYQWSFACFTNHALAALPNTNLVSNIGYGEDATHTTSEQRSTIVHRGMPVISHPTFFIRNSDADAHTAALIFHYDSSTQDSSYFHRIRAGLRRRAVQFLRKFVLRVQASQ